MGYFELLNGSRIICLPLNISEKLLWEHVFEKLEEADTLIFVNTIQYPRTLKSNIYHLNKREPPPFFHSDTNAWPRSGPLCWQNIYSGCNSGNDVVLEYIFFQLCSNTEQIPQVHKIQKKLCKPPCCRSNQPLSKSHCFFAWCVLFKVAKLLFLQLFVPNDNAFA